jgi:predicted dehydrogenase
VRAGEIGDPRFITSVLSQQVRPGDIRTRDELGGGALFDLGIYCINAARYLFQAEPMEVYGDQTAGTEERFQDVDEVTTGLLRFPGNRMAQFTASQGAAGVSEFRVVGTKGDIRLEAAFDYALERREFVTIDDKTAHTVYPPGDQFAPELIHFSSCILEGKEPEPSGEEGLADVRVMEALVRSARIGQKVTLPPFERRQRPTGALMMRKPPVKKVEPVNAPSPSR